MGIGDEIRAERAKADLNAAADAQRKSDLAEDNWTKSLRALDEAAAEIVDACQQLSFATEGTMFNRGWGFNLHSARKLAEGAKSSGRGLTVMFYPDGTWRPAKPVKRCKKGTNFGCIKVCNADDQEWRSAFRHDDFLTVDSILNWAKQILSHPSRTKTPIGHFH